ncbi:MAG TPA: acyltransferase [Candidatus Acidoferrum sp.]|nr:acyltransferase [Candidatus Acidoferrum sp.]
MLRDAVKALGRLLALVAVLPALASFQVRARVLGRDRALANSTQAFGLLPGLLGQYLRRAFLQQTIAYCAPDATIEFGTLFSQAGARVERRAYIGPRCHLGLVHIEEDVLLAAGVHIPSGGAIHGTSDVSRPIRDQEGRVSLVRIGAGAWIGSASVVMSAVGRHAIVGAGSVVTKPVPDYAIAAGVPAKVIRNRLDTERRPA